VNISDKCKVLRTGRTLLAEVSLHPDDYFATLGSYLNNDTFFGKLIRWWERGDASHSSIVFVRKDTGVPALEIHALEGWGVIATEVGVLGKEGAVLELREVEGAEPAKSLLDVLIPLIGRKYQKPLGFITKKREDDQWLWFCSELANHVLKLQNCADHLVSPPWARRSSRALKVFKRVQL